MPRKSIVEPEENQVSVDTSVVAGTTETNDIDAMMAQLKAEMKQRQDEAKAAKAKLRELKGQKTATPREPKAPKPTRTLDDVILEQTEAPKLYAIQRLVIAAEARAKAGQPVAEAVQQVMEQYAGIVLEILARREANAKGTVNAAIVSFLQDNYPKALEAHERGSKNASAKASANSSEPDEASEAE